MINVPEIEKILNEQERIMTSGTQDEIIKFAREYNINQNSQNPFYLENVNKIITRLNYYGIDPATI